MKNRFLECGKIVTTHGIKGELKVEPWADSVDFLSEFDVLYTDKGDKKLKVKSFRTNKNMALIIFEDVDDMDTALTLRGKILYIDRNDVKLEEGNYFQQDLIDMVVKDVDTNEIYGKISQVSETGANDVYHITSGEGKEKLIPAIPQVIIEVDMEKEMMLIRPLKGLFDDED